MKQIAVTIEIPIDGKDAYKHTYTKSVAEGVADVQAISRSMGTGDTDEEQKKTSNAYLVKAFNYGNDLLLRAAERSKASRASEGPAKDIKKAITLLVASGFDEAQARELIIAQRTAKGLPV